MKEDLLKIKKIVDKKRIIDFFDEIGVVSYSINEDLTVDVPHSIGIGGDNHEKIPFNFGAVMGDFYCDGNKLKSLKGIPKYVSGDFYCDRNCLTTLEHIPLFVGGDIECENNNLKTLEHAPKCPTKYEGNPCSYIYDELGFNEEAHARCREVFGL